MTALILHRSRFPSELRPSFKLVRFFNLRFYVSSVTIEACPCSSPGYKITTLAASGLGASAVELQCSRYARIGAWVRFCRLQTIQSLDLYENTM